MNAEPQTWTLPEEPPVGTVVGPVADELVPLGARFERTPAQGSVSWEYDGPTADVPCLSEEGTVEQLEHGDLCNWETVMVSCGFYAREYSDPTDPDGYRQELDALRRKVQELRHALRDADENLTQAERDRDVNGEALSRAQRERGEALRDLEALKNVVQSIARVANQAVTS